MKLHIYQMRHVFADDEHIGKYDVGTKSVRLRAEFADLTDKVKAHFMRAHGIPVKILIGNEALAAVAPLPDFPHEVREAMDPGLGMLSPAAVDHARKHFTRTDFDRLYQGRVEYSSGSGVAPVDPTDEPIDEPKPAKEPKAPKLAKKAAAEVKPESTDA